MWYARYRQDGKLVRKAFGRDRSAAVAYVEKVRTLKRSGEGVVPLFGETASENHIRDRGDRKRGHSG